PNRKSSMTSLAAAGATVPEPYARCLVGRWLATRSDDLIVYRRVWASLPVAFLDSSSPTSLRGSVKPLLKPGGNLWPACVGDVAVPANVECGVQIAVNRGVGGTSQLVQPLGHRFEGRLMFRREGLRPKPLQYLRHQPLPLLQALDATVQLSDLLLMLVKPRVHIDQPRLIRRLTPIEHGQLFVILR